MSESTVTLMERGVRVEKMGVGVNVLAAVVMLFCAYLLSEMKDEQKATNIKLEALAKDVQSALTEQAVLRSLDLHNRLTKVEFSVNSLNAAAHKEKPER